MPGEHQPRQRDRGIRHAADRVHQIVVLHPIIAADEHRMDHQRDFMRVARFPERIEIGIVELAELALGLGADHRAVKALAERLFEHLRRELAALQRHAGQRLQRRQRLDVLQHGLVHEAAPIGALFRRQLVAEDIEPGADELIIDARLAEPFLALVEIVQKHADRPRRRRGAEAEAHARLLVMHLHRRKHPPLRREPFEEGAGNEMTMRVDIQRCLLCGA